MDQDWSFKLSQESQSEELHHLVLLWGDCQLGPNLYVEVCGNWSTGPQEIWHPHSAALLYIANMYLANRACTPILWPGHESAAVKLDLRTAAVSLIGAVKLDLIAELDLAFIPVYYSAAVSCEIAACGEHAAGVISAPLMWPRHVPRCNAACKDRVALFAC